MAPLGGREPRAPEGGTADGDRTFIEAIRDGMAEEMRRDGSVIVLGEDVGRKGGVFLATDGLWGEFGDERVIDTPLTESMIVGASIGAALNGLRPIAEIQFADFITRRSTRSCPRRADALSLEQRLRGAMVLRAPYGGGVHGALYHSQSVEAFFTHVPGAQGGVPSTPYERQGLLRTAIRDDDPVLFFEHKKMYRSVRGEVRTGSSRCRSRAPSCGARPPCHGRRLRADGPLRARGGGAGGGRGDRGRGHRPAHLRPLDRATLLSSVRKTGKCLVAYEDNRFGGYGAEICAIVAEEAFEYLDGPVSRIAGPDVPGVPYNHALEDWFMLSPSKIADAVRRLAAY